MEKPKWITNGTLAMYRGKPCVVYLDEFLTESCAILVKWCKRSEWVVASWKDLE